MTRAVAVAVVGLGYVGLPLAVAFGAHRTTLGFDRDAAKIEVYRRAHDPAGQITADEFAAAKHLTFTDRAEQLAQAETIIVAVPTPVDAAHRPDFTPLIEASEMIGRVMRRGCTVVYESTVYPGATEEICVPLLEKNSGLIWRRDFFVGYSPERINPGDREHTLSRIVKVVAGDTGETLERLAGLYGEIIAAGVHRAASIKVAEAAKVIENTQRDLNIALMNELAIIFDRMDIDTLDVLEAAGTKWNFLPFRPGLVGGHCIGVDPYYLTHKAEMLGYHPQVILAGRRINDSMGQLVARRAIKQLLRAGSPVQGAHVHVLGITFKENVPDTRNSRSFDVIRELQDYGVIVHVHDPVALTEGDEPGHGVSLEAWDDLPVADALIVLVAHETFMRRPLTELTAKLKPGGCFIDVKSAFDRQALAAAGFVVWRL